MRDFTDISFMDSSGIGIIAGRYKKVICFEGKVYAINVDRHIKRILYMSGLDKMIEIVYKYDISNDIITREVAFVNQNL